MRTIHKYTPEEIEFLRQNVPGRTLKEFQYLFNKKFNLNVGEESLQNAKFRYNIKSGITGGQFCKGNIPVNKGKKWSEYMPQESQQGALRTTFKKGNIPHNHRPVGSERITRDGYIEIKIKEPNKWKLKHRLLYENKYGEIPKGHKLIFADGNKLNLNLDNLILVSSSEELIMNRNKLFFDDKTLTKTGALVSKVIDTANKKRKKIKKGNR